MEIEKKSNINLKSSSGVTMIMLVITIIVVLILSGVTIAGAITTDKEAKENLALTEIGMVQHAILQSKEKASLTGKELPGTEIEVADVQSYISSKGVTTITLKSNTGYKTLNQEQLSEIGISKSVDNYIVNYETGEVINHTNLVTKEGNILYIYAVNK